MGLGERAFSKVLQKRPYKERAQPAARRQKVGVLEKKQDYVVRARHRHRHEEQIKGLRLKASTRNADEFYFGMIKGRLAGKTGSHVSDHEARTASIPATMLKLLKSQDVNYMRMQRTTNENKLREVDARISLAEALSSEPRDGAVRPRHTFFAESAEEQAELVVRAAAIPLHAATKESTALQKKHIETLREEAAVRSKRISQLGILEEKLRTDRHLLAKGKRTKIGTDEHGFAKFKWSVERKK